MRRQRTLLVGLLAALLLAGCAGNDTEEATKQESEDAAEDTVDARDEPVRESPGDDPPPMEDVEDAKRQDWSGY